LFYFATEIHERYLYPAIIMLGISALLKPSKSLIGLYGAVSLLLLLNLEKINNYFNIFTTQSIIFSSKAISIGFFITLVWGFIELLRGRKFKEDVKVIINFVRPKHRTNP